MTERQIKDALFAKADYFIRNWIINVDTSIGNEYQVKFSGLLETMIDLDLTEEYADYNEK